MGDKNDNNMDFIFHAAITILCLAITAGAFYGIFLFVRWLLEMLNQLYLYIGGALGVARLAALLLTVCLAALATVVCEQWASRFFTALTWGTAVAGIAAWFVSSITPLPHFFFLGIALYVGGSVLLFAWEHSHTDLHKEISQINEQKPHT